MLVLCGGEVRARNMQQLLREKKIPAALALDGAAVPQRGQVCITVGALSAGSEWPALKLAVLTEGQLTQALSGSRKKPRAAKADNRQKLQSYTDLTVGDLVVHVHHGIGRFAGMIRCRWTVSRRTISKSTMQAVTACMCRPHRWIW